MAPSLLSLPPELHLTVFTALSDFDEALFLSQTCKSLDRLYQNHKKSVQREIIRSSAVYKYDLILSSYLAIASHLAAVFIRTEKCLPEEERPVESILTHCMEIDWTQEVISDDVVAVIADRWEQERYLRGLYLDDLVSKEFELFRARFASNISKSARAAIVQPTLIHSIKGFKIPSVHQCSSDASEAFDPRRLSSDFNERFHQSLCLHSMAIISRTIGKIAKNEEITIPEHPNDLGDETVVPIIDLWSKSSIVMGDEKVNLSLKTKLDCLEIFDFLYIFLIRKVLPFDMLESWTEQDSDEWPYERWAGTGRGSDITHWYSVLNHCRWALLPLDVGDLLRHIGEVDYPPDKHMYMRQRGMFDLGSPQDLDWYSEFERSSMVISLIREEPVNDTKDDPVNPPLIDSEESCWWDHVRLRWGSPFQQDSLTTYLSKLSNKDVLSHDRTKVRLDMILN